MDFHISNDIDVLLGIISRYFRQLSTELLSLLSDKMVLVQYHVNKLIVFDETSYVEVFHFADDNVSLVYSTNSILWFWHEKYYRVLHSHQKYPSHHENMPI